MRRRSFTRPWLGLALSLSTVAVLVSSADVATASGLDDTLGMHVGFAQGSRFRAAEGALNGQLRHSVVFADQASPAAMKSSVWGQFIGPKAFLPAVSTRMNATVTVPLAFGDAKATTAAGERAIQANLQRTARGEYDDDFRIVARNLIAAGYPDAVIRLGNEPDGVFNPWSSIGNEAEYIAAFRHVHDVLAEESSKFRFEYTTTRGGFGARGRAAYPGDAYVDILGLDIYYRISTPLTDQVWSDQYESVLRGHQQFAKERGKPVAYTEWGVAKFDQPEFIDRMHGWFSSLPSSGAGSLVYQSYFNPGDETYALSLYPKTERRYLQLFGGAGNGSAPSPPDIDPPTTVAPTTPSTTAPPATTTTTPKEEAPLEVTPANQYTLFDEAVSHTTTNYANLDVAGLAKWNNRTSHVDGSTFVRLDIVNKPSDKRLQVLVCMWQQSFVKETCNAVGVYTDPGVHYVEMRSLATWWKKNSWNWNGTIENARIMVKDLETGSLLSTAKCGTACYRGSDSAAQHAPIDFDIEMIVVADKATLVPPASWAGCPESFGVGCSTSGEGPSTTTPSTATTLPSAPDPTTAPNPSTGGTVTVSISPGSAKPEGKSLPFVVTLSKASSTPVTLRMRTEDGTAKARVHYRPRDIEVVIPAGSTQAWVGVATIKNRKDSGNVTASFVIDSADGASMVGASDGRPVSSLRATNTILG